MVRSLVGVVRSPGSLALALGAAIGVFLLQVWLANLNLIWSVVTSGAMSVSAKGRFLWASVGAIQTNFTVVGAWLAGAVSLLFGLDIALTVRYVRRRAALGGPSGLGLVGLLGALVGIGCSACGAVVLSSLFGVAASASFVGVLPLGGLEFEWGAVVILLVSVLIVAHQLDQPMTCELPLGRPGDGAPRQPGRDLTLRSTRTRSFVVNATEES